MAIGLPGSGTMNYLLGLGRELKIQSTNLYNSIIGWLQIVQNNILAYDLWFLSIATYIVLTNASLNS